MSFGNSVRADSYSKFVVLLIGVSGLDWWFSEVKTGWSMHQNNNMKGGHSGQQTSWRHANPRLHSVICAVKTKEGGWFLCGVEYRLGVYLRHPQTGKGIREEEEDFFFFFFLTKMNEILPNYIQNKHIYKKIHEGDDVFLLVSVIVFMFSGFKIVEGLSMLFSLLLLLTAHYPE